MNAMLLCRIPVRIEPFCVKWMFSIILYKTLHNILRIIKRDEQKHQGRFYVQFDPPCSFLRSILYSRLDDGTNPRIMTPSAKAST